MSQEQIDIDKGITARLRRLGLFIWFWRTIPLPALQAGTPQAEGLEDDIVSARLQFQNAPVEAVEAAIPILERSVDQVRDTLANTHTRGAQLLPATAFLTVVAGFATAQQIPSYSSPIYFLILALFAYSFAGTLFLSFRTITVAPWEYVDFVARKDSKEDLQRRYAGDCYEVVARSRVRLTQPNGYLRDGQRYFVMTALALGAAVVLRLATGGAALTTPVSGPTPKPHSATPFARPTPQTSRIPLRSPNSGVTPTTSAMPPSP